MNQQVFCFVLGIFSSPLSWMTWRKAERLFSLTREWLLNPKKDCPYSGGISCRIWKVTCRQDMVDVPFFMDPNGVNLNNSNFVQKNCDSRPLFSFHGCLQFATSGFIAASNLSNALAAKSQNLRFLIPEEYHGWRTNSKHTLS